MGLEKGPWIGHEVVVMQVRAVPAECSVLAIVHLSLSPAPKGPGLWPHLLFPKGAMALRLPQLILLTRSG